MADRVFRFRARLAVALRDGSTARLTREIAVEAPCLALARDRLPAVAAECCLDAGSRWFDAPPEAVTVLLADPLV